MNKSTQIFVSLVALTFFTSIAAAEKPSPSPSAKASRPPVANTGRVPDRPSRTEPTALEAVMSSAEDTRKFDPKTGRTISAEGAESAENANSSPSKAPSAQGDSLPPSPDVNQATTVNDRILKGYQAEVQKANQAAQRLQNEKDVQQSTLNTQAEAIKTLTEAKGKADSKITELQAKANLVTGLEARNATLLSEKTALERENVQLKSDKNALMSNMPKADNIVKFVEPKPKVQESEAARDVAAANSKP